MSYDRVLPKPPALHYDSPQASLSRPTSNLLEHKIMSDAITMSDNRMDKAPSYRYSESLPQVNLLSLHRSRLSADKTPTSPSASSTLGLPSRRQVCQQSPFRYGISLQYPSVPHLLARSSRRLKDQESRSLSSVSVNQTLKSLDLAMVSQ
jgi:hypothetical protein